MLVEFSLIVLTSYLILAAVLTFGLLLFQANLVQSVVDAGAQEIARMPLPADAALGLSLQSPANTDANTVKVNQPNSNFNTQIYDEQYLYIPQSQLGSLDLITYASQNLPLINRLLIPALIFDTDQQAYRYPGAS